MAGIEVGVFGPGSCGLQARVTRQVVFASFDMSTGV